LVPLVTEVRASCNQVWFADDATGCDRLKRLLAWLRTRGPRYGYYPKPDKCILVVKAARLEEARRLFARTGVEIVSDGAKDDGTETHTEGARHLGAAVGSDAFKAAFVANKVQGWVDSVHELSKIAASEPQAAFAVFTHCLQGRWTFLSRCVPGLSALLRPLEDAIRLVFLPALLRRHLSDKEREIFSLPARFGGMGITNPAENCENAHKCSLLLSEPLVDLVLRQESSFDPADLNDETTTLKKQLDCDREDACKAKFEGLYTRVNPMLQVSLKVAREKGASSWVTACPLFDHDTVRKKEM